MDTNKIGINYVNFYDYLEDWNEVDKKKIKYSISKYLKGLHNSNLYVPYSYLKTI